MSNTTNTAIPTYNPCTVYPTFGPRTINDDFICGLDFTVTAECTDCGGSGSGGGSGDNSGYDSSCIFITVNITENQFNISNIIVQVELIDPKGAVIKPFGNDAIITGKEISFFIERPTCPSNSNILLEVANIAVRLALPCDGELSGICSGSSGSGSESGDISGVSSGGSVSGGSSGSGTPNYNILFDASSWKDIVPEPTKTYLNSAANIWKNIVKLKPEVIDYMRASDPSWNGIRLDNYSVENNPSSNFIAYCTLNSVVSISSIAYNATSFSLNINFAYGMNASSWTSVLVHELGHALGIGFWNANNYWLSSEYANSLSGYKYLIKSDLDRQYIPVEDNGGAGTAGVHWELNQRLPSYPTPDGFTYPGITDIMTGWLTVPYFISSVSKGYLEDLQYVVSGSAAQYSSILPEIQILSAPSGSSLDLSCWCGCGHNSLDYDVNIVGDLSATE